jgi:hypothetical protein
VIDDGLAVLEVNVTIFIAIQIGLTVPQLSARCFQPPLQKCMLTVSVVVDVALTRSMAFCLTLLSSAAVSLIDTIDMLANSACMWPISAASAAISATNRRSLRLSCTLLKMS